MRLIDADVIKIPETHIDAFENCRYCTLLEKVEVKELIDEVPTIETKQIKYFDEDEKVWKIGEVIVNDR